MSPGISFGIRCDADNHPFCTNVAALGVKAGGFGEAEGEEGFQGALVEGGDGGAV